MFNMDTQENIFLLLLFILLMGNQASMSETTGNTALGNMNDIILILLMFGMFNRSGQDTNGCGCNNGCNRGSSRRRGFDIVD